MSQNSISFDSQIVKPPRAKTGGRQREDLAGNVYGRLTAISPVIGEARSPWNCLCICGNMKKIVASSLKRGLSKSCGCLHKEVISQVKTTHGLTNHPVYGVWTHIIGRCKNPTDVSYPRYGGRGITVDERWLKFENFYEDMGADYQTDLTLDRIDNNRGYSKSNCRWATRVEQARNRGSNITITYRGETKILIEWCEILKLSYVATINRLYRGWSIEQTFELPPGSVLSTHLLISNLKCNFTNISS